VTFLRPGRDARSRQEQYLERLDEVLAVVDPALEPMFARLDKVTEIDVQLADNAMLGWRTETAEIGSPNVLETLNRGYTAEGPDRDIGWSLTGGIAMELLDTGVLRILGVHAVTRLKANGYRKVFNVREHVEVMSPRAIEIAALVARRTAADVERALVAWSESLAE